MNMIREVWGRYPFYGYRRITCELKSEGIAINRKRVQRIMQNMGLRAFYPGPKTSDHAREALIYPYLLRDIVVTTPNQVWQADITYLKLGCGVMYLVALVDLRSRYIVGWRLSNTLDADFCIAALMDALSIARPAIINTDQGCQFTSKEWIGLLKCHRIQISMTGKGRSRTTFTLNGYGEH
jgi:putative transposase